MSTPSSPTPASPAPSAHSVQVILTPSKKVQALLAQFSDSDSEDTTETVSRNATKVQNIDVSTNGSDIASDEEDNEDQVRRPGRLAARLLGESKPTESGVTLSTATETEPSSTSQQPADVGSGRNNLTSSDDELTKAIPARKRLRFDHGRDSREKTTPAQTPERHSSPLFFPSPTSEHSNVSPNRAPRRMPSSPAESTKPSGRSKFLALVDKHRKERLAREAEEIAKRAAGVSAAPDNGQRRVRGSSPADDSSEGAISVDEDAVKRIQKEARPTRKASKKALEEMNRETQRMSRNMQLAHQATTKNKVTKESLLARFNFVSETSDTQAQSGAQKSLTASSSATVSDAESTRADVFTPPTSPVRGTDEQVQKTNISASEHMKPVLASEQMNVEMHVALAYGDEIPDLEQGLSKRVQEQFDCRQRDVTTLSHKADQGLPMLDEPAPHQVASSVTGTRSGKANLIRAALYNPEVSDSDNEIEIVRDRGIQRKFAIFEHLPKRKAKQTPSHIALRSLAYLVGSDDKKRTMNAAELEASLRRKARIQALKERREKIEELKAKGIVIQSAEEREHDQQVVEDLVERARQEATEIQRREKELAKKNGTYVKDDLDDGDDDDSEDGDFEEELDDAQASGSDMDDEHDDNQSLSNDQSPFVADEVDEQNTGSESEQAEIEKSEDENLETTTEPEPDANLPLPSRPTRNLRVISDDEDDDHPLPHGRRIDPPRLPPYAKTPQSVPRSGRKIIPGLQMSDDLPMGLSQAFAATMAGSQSQDSCGTPAEDSFDLTADLPGLEYADMPLLQRLDSIELISDSQPLASQTQPLDVNLLPHSQVVPESPRGPAISATQYTPSQRQMPFDLTQDNGYILSPFAGNRFSETPTLRAPKSTVETVIVPSAVEESPVVQRRGRLHRGHAESQQASESDHIKPVTAFEAMRQAANSKVAQAEFDKKKSNARNIVDEAAEESEDEYAGLGGASDDSGDDDENDDDRRMIDEDTHIGAGDESKLAGFYADRERERDEKEVSKLLKDITTGALRRKRGVGDDLDLSDEEDAAARRRETKRREFARMRRELLKDEAVGKIAEDRKKEAFLRSMEDREDAESDEDELDTPEESQGLASQSTSQVQDTVIADSQGESQAGLKRKRPLDVASDSDTNRQPPALRRTNPNVRRKPATLGEIRESVSFLIEEPDSQAAMIDLGLSDSEDEPEAYVDLDRHFRETEADENGFDDDHGDLGDFVVDDDIPSKSDSQKDLFKKPERPPQERASFTERRTKDNEVIDRLSLLRQASSSASSTMSTGSASTKMAFFSSRNAGSFSGVPTLLRRATTNSSIGSRAGHETVSATGVVTNKTERGNAAEEKEFVRKGNSGRRNAVNYQAERKTLREEKMDTRASALKSGRGKKAHGFLGGLLGGSSWD